MDVWFTSLINNDSQYGFLLFVFLTALISAVLAAIIGIERELKGQAAGLRTHVLVSVGCSILMSLSVYGIKLALLRVSDTANVSYDPGRIAAGILTGIGFIGAGTIIKFGTSIRGLTTATTIWLSAAIGMACGSGFVLEAIVVTALALAILIGLYVVEGKIQKRCPKVVLKVEPGASIIHVLRSEAENFGLIIKKFVTQNKTDENNKEYVEIVILFAYHSTKTSLNNFVSKISNNPNVYSIALLEHKEKSKEHE